MWNPVEWWLRRAVERREGKVRARAAYKSQVAGILETARTSDEALARLHQLDREWRHVDLRP